MNSYDADREEWGHHDDAERDAIRAEQEAEQRAEERAAFWERLKAEHLAGVDEGEPFDWAATRAKFDAIAAQAEGVDIFTPEGSTLAALNWANRYRGELLMYLDGMQLTPEQRRAVWVIGIECGPEASQLARIFAKLNAMGTEAYEQGRADEGAERSRKAWEKRCALNEARKAAIENNPFAAALDKAGDELNAQRFTLARERTEAGKVDVSPAFRLLARWCDTARKLLDQVAMDRENLAADELVELYAELVAALAGAGETTDGQKELQSARWTVWRVLGKALKLAEPIAMASRTSYEKHILGDD